MEITYKTNKTVTAIVLAGISKQTKLNFRDFSEMESFSEPRFVFLNIPAGIWIASGYKNFGGLSVLGGGLRY